MGTDCGGHSQDGRQLRAPAGRDFHAWGAIVDFLLVKHYFWHRGFDGMYGTVARWVKQLRAWNPVLDEADCFTVARAWLAWLGVDLPETRSIADMDRGFPPALFERVVPRETARAIAAAGDAGKLVPWVNTSRLPHGGDPMTAGDLDHILRASEGAGLQRFLFHNHATSRHPSGASSRGCAGGPGMKTPRPRTATGRHIRRGRRRSEPAGSNYPATDRSVGAGSGGSTETRQLMPRRV